MGLPIIPLRISSVKIGGQSVPFRSLSRKEAYKLGTEFKENADAGESFLIACAMGVTEADAEEWRQTTDTDIVGKLVDAIVELSALSVEGKSGPKAQIRKPSSSARS